MLIVEVGFELNNDLKFYDKMLKEHKLDNCFNCETHDIYYTNKDLDGLTENEIKNSCIRLRCVNDNKCKVQNFECFVELKDIVFNDKTSYVESILKQKGFKKVFDTKKKDHHYRNSNMNSRIQLQEIEDIGLLVYYDNSDYYNLSLDEQRNKLIDELNKYGFEFKYTDLGLDKLRTLYYNRKMYSKNQNG